MLVQVYQEAGGRKSEWFDEVRQVEWKQKFRQAGSAYLIEFNDGLTHWLPEGCTISVVGGKEG